MAAVALLPLSRPISLTRIHGGRNKVGATADQVRQLAMSSRDGSGIQYAPPQRVHLPAGFRPEVVIDRVSGVEQPRLAN